jgi:threonine synthase
MRYTSTRDGRVSTGAAAAVVKGISEDGGLFVPRQFPDIGVEQICEMAQMRYWQVAARVLSGWLGDFSGDELSQMCEAAYRSFDTAQVAPIHSLEGDRHVLELFHGPTLAFKDVALQFLPHLMSASARKVGEARRLVILVATSGDTGKAALAGFADVPGVIIVVYYPDGGVSEAQRLQMVTQQGENTRVIAVSGNFDDAQTGVKRMFTDRALTERLDRRGMVFSSANSINLGRLVPQIAYYFWAYAQLIDRGRVAPGRPVNLCVPTGNFGNILAAWYAREMGLPVARLICASNQNNVLADFIRTGVYDSNRPFHLTTSPSMDILISSNLERLLFELTGRDDAAVRGLMADLSAGGRYALARPAHQRLAERMSGGWADEAQVAAQIASTFRDERYLVDPHTAVALSVHRRYAEQTEDRTPTIIAATASPFKFGKAVAEAIFGQAARGLDDFACCDMLAGAADMAVPPAIAQLREKPVVHSASCGRDGMQGALLSALGIEGR